MTVRVGVIGVGNIGQDHVRRLNDVVTGAEVVGVTDVDPRRAEAVAAATPKARPYPTGQHLIRDDNVDAILVASWGPTHEEFVLSAIDEGKPVFCEKPLATTQAACLRVLDAEASRGRRLVQVGFMRRYDADYRALKDTFTRNQIGPALLVHCAHRNPVVPEQFTSDMPITDAVIHEIDTVRWLLGQEIAAATVLRPRRTSKAYPHLQDPQIVLLETDQGAIIDVEVFVNCSYGYDIRCEIVAESGTAALPTAETAPANWRERFGRAYDVELQDWVDSVIDGQARGPGSWDGYAAAVVADGCLVALETGERTEMKYEDRP